MSSFAAWTREGEAWRSTGFGAGEEIDVAGVATLRVDDIYAAARGA